MQKASLLGLFLLPLLFLQESAALAWQEDLILQKDRASQWAQSEIGSIDPRPREARPSFRIGILAGFSQYKGPSHTYFPRHAVFFNRGLEVAYVDEAVTYNLAYLQQNWLDQQALGSSQAKATLSGQKFQLGAAYLLNLSDIFSAPGLGFETGAGLAAVLSHTALKDSWVSLEKDFFQPGLYLSLGFRYRGLWDLKTLSFFSRNDLNYEKVRKHPLRANFNQLAQTMLMGLDYAF